MRKILIQFFRHQRAIVLTFIMDPNIRRISLATMFTNMEAGLSQAFYKTDVIIISDVDPPKRSTSMTELGLVGTESNHSNSLQSIPTIAEPKIPG